MALAAAEHAMKYLAAREHARRLLRRNAGTVQSIGCVAAQFFPDQCPVGLLYRFTMMRAQMNAMAALGVTESLQSPRFGTKQLALSYW